MVKLQQLVNGQWCYVGTFKNEDSAWDSLNGNDDGYRTIDSKGNVLTDYS